MANTIIGIGNKIELRALRWKNPDETPPVYVSQLLDFTGKHDENLLIAMPIFEGHLVPLEVGKQFEACFSAGKGLYKAECTVVNRIKKNNIYMLEVVLDTQLKKFQRREYFRLNCNIQVNFQVLSEEERALFIMAQQLKPVYGSDTFSGTAIDISGGGLRVICKDNFNRGDYVVVSMYLDGGNGGLHLRLPANIINCTRTDNDLSKYDLRLQFIFEDKEQQERIIKYIFEEQRRRMKSGQR